MKLMMKLWRDEFGLVLSAEAVCVGTVGVVGAITGLSLMSSAVNAEMQDLSFAIRSLDQSYFVAGRRSYRARTAMSCFQQEDVKKSLSELRLLRDRLQEAASEQQQQESDRRSKEAEKPKAQEETDRERRPSNEVSYPEA